MASFRDLIGKTIVKIEEIGSRDLVFTTSDKNILHMHIGSAPFGNIYNTLYDKKDDSLNDSEINEKKSFAYKIYE